jgi:hypothetical protein
MLIAIHCDGDWNDAEVTPEVLQALLRDGAIRFSGEDTAQAFDESEALPIYNADEWPGWDTGFTYIQDSPSTQCNSNSGDAQPATAVAELKS